MRERSVSFYKKLILFGIGALILIPTGLAIFLSFENLSMKSRLADEDRLADDAVTIGTTQIEPAGVARDEPVLSYQTLYPAFKAGFFGFNDDLAGDKSIFLTFDDGPSPGTAEILDVLKKHGVPATFFVNGKVVGNLEAAAKVVLNPRASIDGNISAAGLSMMDGAELKGSVNVHKPV